MTTSIKPTIGRKIYYYPKSGEAISGMGDVFNKGDQPFDATIVYVHANEKVNLVVRDHEGNQFTRKQVEIIPLGTKAPEDTAYAQWMEYQVSQQAKRDLQTEHGMGEKAAEIKVHSGQLGDDRTATEGEPQRGDPADPDPRTPPTVEHVSADVKGRVDSGLPPEETEKEKQDKKTAEEKAEAPTGKSKGSVHPSLNKKK